MPRGTSQLRRTGFRVRLSEGEVGGRTRINRQSAKRKSLAPTRARATDALRERQGGICLRCVRSGLLLHGHELLGMAHGADYTRPDMALCDPCNGAVEDYPIRSAWDGWKISVKNPRDPSLPAGCARALDGTVVTLPESRLSKRDAA